jgi:type II secretory pathway predicted ATPase ExeA
MYQAFYQLKQPIGCKSIAIEDLFMFKSFREAGARLEYMKDKGGFVLVSGPSGVGKTTLLRSFTESLDSKFFKVAYAALSTVSVIDFYRQMAFLLAGYAPSTKVQLFRTIQEIILELTLKQHTLPVIIFDDAHFLRNENFFELQLISNFNFDSLSPALFVLIAQPHLLERLKRPAFDAFYQRINLKINLQPLSFEETQLFISHVISKVKTNVSSSPGSSGIPSQNSQDHHLFTPAAIELIFKRSRGLVRQITTIMEQALRYGAANDKQIIDENVICDIEPEL